VVYVTHDQVEAMTLGDKIVVMNQRPSRASLARLCICIIIHRHSFVAGFIGSPKMNFLSARVTEVGPENTQIMLESGRVISAAIDSSSLEKGAHVQLGLRPEHMSVNPATRITLEGGNYIGRTPWRAILLIRRYTTRRRVCSKGRWR